MINLYESMMKLFKEAGTHIVQRKKIHLLKKD